MSALDVVCRDCSSPFQIDTTGWPQSGIDMLRARLAELMCEECCDAEEAAERSEEALQLEAEAGDLHRRRLRDSGVPAQAGSFVWPAGEAGEAARRWAQRKSRVLTLTGPVGTGKTALAAAAFRVRLKPIVRDGRLVSRRGAWRSMTSYLAALSASFDSPTKADAVELAQGGVMVALDDIDKVRPTEYAAEAVFCVVNAAVETRSPLIVTTNCTLSELASRFGSRHGEAIASRLAEGDVATLTGTDRRLAGGVR